MEETGLKNLMDRKTVLRLVGDNLRRLMNQQNMSSTTLARTCGISNGTVSKILNANMAITIPMAMTLPKPLSS